MAAYLVVAAMGTELRPLARRLGRARRLQRAEFDARETELAGRRVVLLRTGVGRTSTAAVIGKMLEEFRPDRIFSIGLAGALRPEYRVGEHFMVSSSALWRGDSTTLSLEQAIELEEVFSDPSPPLVPEIKGTRKVHRGRLLTLDAFVNTAMEKRKLGAAGFDLVDMEFSAVARCASEAGIPLRGLRVVSDSALHDFPSFRYYDGRRTEGLPPPRLVANALRACKALGGFVFAWLRAEIAPRDAHSE